MSWTDERIELLKTLWTDGLSASQIAAEMGGITRNAVIGKAHRLKLPGRTKKVPARRQPRVRIVPPEPMPEIVDNVIPLGQRRTLLELKEETCRWPIGDPGSADFFFCGGGARDGAPYCAGHCCVAYQPQALRPVYVPRRMRA
jgi:GcrA cell cycle regulator